MYEATLVGQLGGVFGIEREFLEKLP